MYKHILVYAAPSSVYYTVTQLTKNGKKFDVIPLQHHVTLSHHCIYRLQ